MKQKEKEAKEQLLLMQQKNSIEEQGGRVDKPVSTDVTV
jgi:hypothetical protein